MLKLVGIIISLLLIGIIFLRLPRESLGLSSFALGSSSSSERSLNFVTALGILIYFGIAIRENLLNNSI